MNRLLFVVVLVSNLSLFAFKNVQSKVVHHGEVVTLTAKVKGLKVLYLVADSGKSNSGDHAVWGNPITIDKTGKEKSATTLKIKNSAVGYGKLIKNSAGNKPLSIAGKKYEKGFFAHADSFIALQLPRGCKTFKVQVGIQDGLTNGSVTFKLLKMLSPPKIPVQEKAVRLAIIDLMNRFATKYPNGKQYLAKLAEIEKIKDSDKRYELLLALQRKALLDNPLLKRFEKIIAVRRQYKGKARQIRSTATPGINAYCLEVVNVASGKDNIVTISDFASDKSRVKNFYTPQNGGHIAEMDLHFDADKLMYSGKGNDGKWHLLEVDEQGEFIRQLTPNGVDYNSFDSCYLPNGKIVYTSTAPVQGLPCESGRLRMSNSYLLDPKDKNIRRLTFDQDANWGPTVMRDGKVLYLRWEYTDTAHMFTRILMTMNPDGTSQKHYYGSNSYWPNACSTPKPIPGSSSKFIGVISGHHVGRPGPICIFDTEKGFFEADGAIQMIPGYGKKVDPIIKDYLYGSLYPKFQNPIPLGDNEADGASTYFLASAKLSKDSLWGIYLVDIYENYVLLSEEEDYAMGEPIPLKKTPKPPQIPSRVNLDSKTATIYIQNIYEGPGLKNIPVGKVKKLRLFTYHYSYYKAGSHEAIGLESSWDVKHVLGTVPVYADGSASFQVPANTPIAIQPLDENGAALQLMRSWFTAMPGEVLSCVGCHESPDTAALTNVNMALRKMPTKIKTNIEPERNFAFLREVQPILHKNCIACHNPQSKKKLADGNPIPDFKTITLKGINYPREGREGGPFSVSYLNINPYTFRPGPESDYHLPNPMEYHSSVSRLTQILNSGHHGVKLTKAEMLTLNSWIDLNVPFWGSWNDAHRDWENSHVRKWARAGNTNKEQLDNIKKYRALRKKYQKMYDNTDTDFELDQYPVWTAKEDLALIKPVMPKMVKMPMVAKLAGWPFTTKDAKIKQGANTTKRVAINGIKIDFKKIPTGSFIMGCNRYQDSCLKQVRVTKSFWMAEKEVTNALFVQFKKEHDSGFMDEHGKDHTRPGIEAKTGSLPVIRVSWSDAQEFTKWLSKKSGKKFRLPTEEEWEFAARAGTSSDFYWGDAKSDFGKYANFADKSIVKFNWKATNNYRLRNEKVDDKAQIQTQPGNYQPNAFGLYDMLGNVAEWTSSNYQNSDKKISKGGAWCDLPRWAPVGAKVPYEKYQRINNVGIRLVLDD